MTATRYERFIPNDALDAGLFATRDEFKRQLDAFVESIAPPSGGPGGAALSFAVHGQWGSGKSTAVRYIRDLAASRGYLTSELEAPLWAGRTSARAAVAFAVAAAVEVPSTNSSGMPGEGLTPRLLLEAVIALGRSDANEPRGLVPATTDPANQLVLATSFVHAFEQTAAFGPACEQWMLGRVANDVPRIIFIDDLDRCPPAFIAELLAATAYWVSLGRGAVRFVIAADRDHLLDAMREVHRGSQVPPDQALQKYVHVAVTVPPYFRAPEEVARFLVTQVARLGFAGVAESQIDWLQDQYATAGERYVDGALAPLLRTDATMNPRRVNNALNRVHAGFGEPEGGTLDEMVLKRMIIMAEWREFYFRVLSPALLGEDDDSRERVRKIVAAAMPVYRHLWHTPAEVVDVTLRAALGHDSALMDGVDPYLALYLAAEPAVILDEGVGQKATERPRPSGGDSEPFNDKERSGVTTELVRSLQPASTATEGDAARPAVQGSPSDDVFLAYLLADEAIREARPEAARRALDEIIAVSRSGRLTATDAPRVGNAALRAEALEDGQRALDLHQAAVALDPDHWNVQQNYVDFIISEGLEELYSAADAALDRLRTQGAAHKPERTALLRARLAFRTTGRIPGEFSKTVRSLADGVVDLEGLIAAYPVLTEAREFTMFHDAGRRAFSRSAQPDARYQILRLVADALAMSSDDADERTSASIYRHLIETSGTAIDSPEERAAVTSNFAINLMSIWRRDRAVDGFKDHALWLWYTLYKDGVADDTIRQVFARSLSEAGHSSAALKVLTAQRLTPPPPEEPRAPLPDLAVGREPWWKEFSGAAVT